MSLIHAFFLVAFVVSLVAAVALALNYQNAERRVHDSALARAEAASEQAAQVIGERLREVMPAAQAIADDIGAGRLDIDDLSARFESVLRDHPLAYGVGAAFEPFAHAGETRLYAPFLHRQEGQGTELHRIDRTTDYTAFAEGWYREPLLNGAMWRERYFAEGGFVLTQFGVPVYGLGEGSTSAAPIGIVFIAYDLPTVAKFIATEDAGHSGYRYVVSRDGRYIVHPRRDLVRGRKTAFEQAQKSGDVAMFSLMIRSVKGERGYIDHIDELTGESTWIVHEPVPVSGWSVITVLSKHRLLDPDKQRRAYINVLLMGVLAAVFLTAFVVDLRRFDETAAWFGSVALAVYLVVAVGFIWIFTDRYPPRDETQVGEQIISRTSLEHYLNSYSQELADLSAAPPIYVPTGVFVQSIEFASGNDVKVTGYIWQKYRKGVHRGVSRGFVLPEAENPLIREVYRRTLSDDFDADSLLASLGSDTRRLAAEGESCGAQVDPAMRDCSELIGWYFFANLRQDFSYRRYPFDHQDVWLRLWHKDFDGNIVLVPDLKAYDSTDPKTLSGVEKNFVLPGWTIEGAGFKFRRHGYGTNFGIGGYVGQQNFPELYYSVSIGRALIGPFVVHFVPQLVVASMLFMLLLMGSKDGEKAKWLGFATKDVLRGSSVLLIVLVFAHTALRNKLFSPTLVYSEYFYIVLYVASLLVSCNSIIFATGAVKFIQYRDNLLPKLLFLPAVAIAVFFITLASLY